ncbi:MAG TPA: hypothetical protein VIA06_03310 [Candidatus Dormibacteraeota bacterium]|jgi:uridine kinase|nr:hypothetical protein [Candidatus Dormibacteraeota bacterium]
MPALRTIERLDDLVTRLHHQPRRKLTLLVGVDGPSGSGKTTLTLGLARLDPEITVVAMDDFAVQPAPDAPGLAVAVDWRAVRNQVLLPLQTNRPGAQRGSEIGVGGIVIVEGVFSSLRQLRSSYDMRIWVDASEEVRRARRGPRAGEQEYLAETPEAGADLVVDGSGSPAHDRAHYVRVRET